MRKGIVATIAIHSLVQLMGFIVISLISRLLPIVYSSPEFVPQYLFALITIPIPFLVFIILGFHLRRKYNESLTYLKFVLVGFIISVVTSTVYYSGIMVVNVLSGEDISPFWFQDTVVRIGVLILFLTVMCLVVAIFHKRLKFKNKVATEALDSNIVNDE